jgi:type IV pilus assembly protein PilQ
MINRRLILIFFVLFFASPLWAGEINSVVSEGNILKIQLTEKSEFKKIPQEDPFKLKIEIQNTKPGILNKKMLFHEGIVSEVYAQEGDKGSIIEILLAEPSETEIKAEGNVLVFSFNKEAKKATSSQIPKIIDLTMEKTDEGFEISIQGDIDLPEPSVVKDEKYINVEFSKVKFEAEPSKDIPLSVKREGDEVILSFFFGKEFDIEPIYLGDEVILNINKIKPKEIKTAETPKETAKTIPQQNSVTAENKTISLDLQDADIVGVFRLLGDVSGYNMVIHPEVKGKITLKLINVPWTKALDIICQTFHLQRIIEGNIIRVAPLKVFQEEKKLQAETKELFKKAEDTDTKIFTLRYATPDKVKAAIEGAKLLSPQGNIVIDDRTRAIIVKDIPSALNDIGSFIANLDKPIKQILLETRIVEISSSFAKSIGFEWGITWAPPGSRTTIVGSQSGTTTVTGGTTPIGINLPASSGTSGAGTTAFTLGYINASGTFALDVRISALQESGKGKIISNPKIITMDNQKAKIVQGESIPYGEKDVQSGQISTKFKDVAITVETTPHMIDEKSLQLDLNVIKEDLVEFVNIGGVYAPRTTKLEGNTKVSLKDGETLVIGGIYKKKDTTRDSKVPLLGDIPLAGELFKSTGRDESLYEVMIFITPRILSYE